MYTSIYNRIALFVYKDVYIHTYICIYKYRYMYIYPPLSLSRAHAQRAHFAVLDRRKHSASSGLLPMRDANWRLWD